MPQRGGGDGEEEEEEEEEGGLPSPSPGAWTLPPALRVALTTLDLVALLSGGCVPHGRAGASGVEVGSLRPAGEGRESPRVGDEAGPGPGLAWLALLLLLLLGAGVLGLFAAPGLRAA